MSSQAGEQFSDGAAYERLMGRWSRLVGEKFLDWLAAPQGLRWIDVGCGNGAFTEVLIARCAPSHVSGIDPSEAQLAFAASRPGAKSAQFRLGSAEALPFPDNSFDAAGMALVLAFVSNTAKAAGEMARVVRPGGVVAAYMWDIPGGGLPVAPIQAALKTLGIEPPARLNTAVSTREVMEAVWVEAGLQNVETRVIRIPVEFSSFDEFWQSSTVPIGPTGQALKAMSASDKEQLKSRLREQLPAEADGRIVYEAFANAVKGRVPQ